jgi:hypothetical protein
MQKLRRGRERRYVDCLSFQLNWLRAARVNGSSKVRRSNEELVDVARVERVAALATPATAHPERGVIDPNAAGAHDPA